MSDSTRNYNEGELPGAGQIEGKKMLIFILAEHFTLRRLMRKGEFAQRRGEGSKVLQTCFIYPALPPTFWHPDLLDMVPPLLVPNAVSGRFPLPTHHSPCESWSEKPWPRCPGSITKNPCDLEQVPPPPSPPRNPHSTHTDTLTFSSVSALEGLQACFEPQTPAFSRQDQRPHPTPCFPEHLPCGADAPAHLRPPQRGGAGRGVLSSRERGPEKRWGLGLPTSVLLQSTRSMKLR